MIGIQQESDRAALRWRALAFDALTLHELYDLLQLRSAVFVVEQNCVFLDLDGSDADAMHLVGHMDGQLVAYARCFGPGQKFAEASIGRIVTRDTARSSGIGHLLLRQAVHTVVSIWGAQPIRIGAQTRLKGFYQGHGFEDVGRAYVEDGIDHLEMLWRPVEIGDSK